MPAKKAAPKVSRGDSVGLKRAGPCRRMLHEADDGPSRLPAAYFGWIFCRRRGIGVPRVQCHEHPRGRGGVGCLGEGVRTGAHRGAHGGLECFPCHLEVFDGLVDVG
jgi:hypothetical protein